jgi:hypothetical protein
MWIWSRAPFRKEIKYVQVYCTQEIRNQKKLARSFALIVTRWTRLAFEKDTFFAGERRPQSFKRKAETRATKRIQWRSATFFLVECRSLRSFAISRFTIIHQDWPHFLLPPDHHTVQVVKSRLSAGQKKLNLIISLDQKEA